MSREPMSDLSPAEAVAAYVRQHRELLRRGLEAYADGWEDAAATTVRSLVRGGLDQDAAEHNDVVGHLRADAARARAVAAQLDELIEMTKERP
jgi:hypothetical protein